MYSYTIIAVCLVGAECLRRLCKTLLTAYTGPLSKIPGPFWDKFTIVPWMIPSIRGDTPTTIPELFEKYGNTVRVGPNVVLVTGPKAVMHVLGHEDFPKDPKYAYLREDPKIANLFNETDKAAYKIRVSWDSGLAWRCYLNGLEPLMQSCVQVFEEVTDAKCKAAGGFTTIDFDNAFSNLTSDIMSATSFGGSLELSRSEDFTLRNAFKRQQERAAIDVLLPFLKYFLGLPAGAKTIKNIVDQVLKKRLEKTEKESKNDLLQIIINIHHENPAAFTEKHVRDEMADMMLAGSDTAATTLTFMLLQLVNHPTELAILIADIDAAFPALESPITFETTQNLPYLNAVINEGMRCMPLVLGGLPRLVNHSTTVNGYEIPPNTILSTSISNLSWSSTHFPEPKSFVPARWLPKEQQPIPTSLTADKSAFLPFSTGSRSCIGQQFAMREIRLILVRLLKRYELSLVEGQSHEVKYHLVAQLAAKKYFVGVRLRPGVK